MYWIEFKLFVLIHIADPKLLELRLVGLVWFGLAQEKRTSKLRSLHRVSLKSHASTSAKNVMNYSKKKCDELLECYNRQ